MHFFLTPRGPLAAPRMGSWYRSSPMTYVQLYIEPSSAKTVVETLGDDTEGFVQFLDVSARAQAIPRAGRAG